MLIASRYHQLISPSLSKTQVSSVQNPQRRPFKNCLLHSISGCISHFFHKILGIPHINQQLWANITIPMAPIQPINGPWCRAARSRCASFLPKPRCCNQAAHALLQHWSWPIFFGAAPIFGSGNKWTWRSWVEICGNICGYVM